MRIPGYLVVLLSFAWSPPVWAELQTYDTPHFRIHSPMNPRYVRYIERNAEAYYDNLTPEFFAKGFDEPLAIFYFPTQSETRQYLWGIGLLDVNFGVYIKETKTPFGVRPTMFMHRRMEDDTLSGWGTLFHEITHHFVRLNYDNPPTWFNEGLSAFLGERTRIVKGVATIGQPHPRRASILKSRIEDGFAIDVKHLVSLSRTEFHEAQESYPLARVFFYWLHHTGRLQDYLQAAKEEGYKLSALKRVVGTSGDEMNRDLLAFIETYSYPAAYAYEISKIPDAEQQRTLLQSVLELEPTYEPVRLAASQYVCNEQKDVPRCREALQDLIKDEPSTEVQVRALQAMGATYFKEKDFETALHYYQKALDYSDYDEEQYRLLFHIASCYHLMDDRANAKEYYRKFLAADWEPNLHPSHTETALKIIRQ